MAKNLKFNIKNAQLAEALQLNKLPKSKPEDAASKKKGIKKEESLKPLSEERSETSFPAAETPAQEVKPKLQSQESEPSFREEKPTFSSEKSSSFIKDASFHKERSSYKPFKERPPYQKPQGDRPYQQTTSSDRPYQKTTSGDRPYQRTPSTDRPYQRTTSSDRPYQQTPSSDRPYQKTPNSDRPYTPSTDRPYQRTPSSSDRPYQRTTSSDRPPYQSRPYQKPAEGTGNRRPFGEKTEGTGARPYKSYENRPSTPGDKPYAPRPYAPRPYQKPGERPAYNRPSHNPSEGRSASDSFPPRRFERTPRPASDRSAIVDDFRKPKIIRKNPPAPLKRLSAPRQDDKKPLTRMPSSAPADAKSSNSKVGVFKDFKEVRSQRKTTSKKSFDSRDRMGLREGEEDRWRKKRAARKDDKEDLTIRPKNLNVRLPVSIKDLAVLMKLKASQLISKLFTQGIITTINDFLSEPTVVELLGHEFDCTIQIDTSEEKRIQITDKTIKEEVQATDPSKLSLRSPVITFMGHVDHGKTSLIDAIRKSNLTTYEAGAITQHIGAFKCHTDVGDITILDTPGHEAFSAMRERGAEVTDLVVLVIAGDEGMKDQTIEAINKAKEANVPILVAINKSDKPGFNAEDVYRQLSEKELLPEAWGGTTITVNCSATTGQGIKELLEMLALQSEVLELKADFQARARGTVLESAMHKGLGCVATVLVQNGTLRVGDSLVFDLHYGRVKTMQDEHDRHLQEALPSTPVKITGLSGLPDAGSEFITVSNEKESREIAITRQEEHKHKLLKGKRGLGEISLESKAADQEKKVLNILLRADVQGSLGALKQSLEKIKSDKVKLHIVAEGVGQISESDISLAAASEAVILGFHTKIESHAEALIKSKKVSIKLHNIIYHAIDDIKELMRSLLDKIALENDTGSAEVRAVFKSSHLGRIAGCHVLDGILKRNQHARLKRDKQMLWKGSIASIKREKEDVREVSKGFECGLLLQGFNDFKEGDIIEAYEITYLEQEL